MKLLLVCHQPPFPADNGGKMRTFHLARQFARRHQLLVLCPPLPTADLAALREQLGPAAIVVTAPLPRQDGPLAPLRHFSTLPRGVLRAGRGSPLAEALAEQVRAWRPDALMVADPLLGEYLRPYNGLARIVDVAQEYNLYISRVAQTARGLDRLRWRLRLRKWALYTGALAAHVDLWLVPGAVDRDGLLPQLPAGDMVAIVPNGVDLERNPYGPNLDAPAQICATGALSYEPNRDGLEYFFGSIWPLIRRRMPELTMRITGESRGAPAVVRQAPGVTLTGHLPLVRPVVTGSRALVVPLRLGVGTRLKIMEAMALGTPVVATPIGAEGLAVNTGEQLMLAETPAEFAAAVIDVAQSPELRKRLSIAGRRLVEERYAWDVIGAGLLLTLERSLGRAGAIDAHSTTIEARTS